MYSKFDDRTLLVMSRRDQGAFSALFERHAAAVFRYCLGASGEIRDAEDLSQEVFFTAWRKGAGMHLAGDSALPWLLVTARNLSRNLQRRQWHRASVSLDESIADAQKLDQARNRTSAAEELVWVRAEIARLSGMDQRICQLCLEHGYSYAEAAEQLGLSSPALAKRLERVRLRVRQSVRGQS